MGMYMCNIQIQTNKLVLANQLVIVVVINQRKMAALIHVTI